MRGHCADPDVLAGFANVAEAADPPNINQQSWLRQAQLHCGKQTVAAGEDLGVFA